jgi:hypothetical protein
MHQWFKRSTMEMEICNTRNYDEDDDNAMDLWM